MPRRLLATIALLVAVAVGSPDTAGAEEPAPEAQVLAHINATRATAGVPPLTTDPVATGVAQEWAAEMAAAGRISHRADLRVGMPANWSMLGENVGTSGSVAALGPAFVASPTHYANLVDARFRTVGIGVAVAGDRVFVAQEFLTTASPKAAVVTKKKARRVRARTVAPRRRMR